MIQLSCWFGYNLSEWLTSCVFWNIAVLPLHCRYFDEIQNWATEFKYENKTQAEVD